MPVELDTSRKRASEKELRSLETAIRNHGALEDLRPVQPDPTASEQYRTAFWAYLRHGFSGLSGEARQLLYYARKATAGQIKQRLPEPYASRSMSSEIGPAGGYLVPEGFYNRVVEVLKDQAGMRRSRATILPTDTGERLPIPTTDDTSNTGTRVNENTQMTMTGEDVTFGQEHLGGYWYSSNGIKVPIPLIQDAGPDLEGFFARILGQRIGRVTNADFTNGTGNDMPTGVADVAVVGKTAAAADAITRAELAALKQSVDVAYRINRPEWMMNSNTQETLENLTATGGQPLFHYTNTGRLLSLGFPVVLNEDMPDIAASAKPVLFGDFSQYWIRDVGRLVLVRLNERYADTLQAGFLAYSRHDATLVNASAGPVKALQMASS